MRTPARDRAISYLYSHITDSSAKGTYRLPSLDALALSARVSRMTMWHAVRTLRDQGILRSMNSPGTVIAAIPVPAPANLTLPGPVDFSLEARISRAIAEGTYKTGTPFPRIKELCTTYGVGYRRMHAALEQLADEGLLGRGERRFVVADTAFSSRRSILVFIAASDDMTILADATPRSIEFWRVLEQETATRGISLMIMTHQKAVRAFLPKNQQQSETTSLNGHPIVGFICWNLTYSQESYAQLGMIATATDRPLAIFNEQETVTIPAPVATNQLCRVYPMYGTVHAGTLMGTYLLANGYRRVAFVTPDASTPLSRSQGIARVYGTAGMSDAVTVFAPLLPDPESKSGDESLVAQTNESNRLVINMLRRQGVAVVDTDNHQLGVWNRRFISRIELRTQLTPTFDRILDKKEYDILVGYNDDIAILALEHLRKRNIAVPRTLSVAGFDDTVTAIGQGLTSYNWSVSQTVHSMLEFILRPADFNRLFRHEGVVVEVDGRVMARGTTRSQ